MEWRVWSVTCGHRHYGPPEGRRDRDEGRALAVLLSVVEERREDEHRQAELGVGVGVRVIEERREDEHRQAEEGAEHSEYSHSKCSTARLKRAQSRAVK